MKFFLLVIFLGISCVHQFFHSRWNVSEVEDAKESRYELPSGLLVQFELNK